MILNLFSKMKKSGLDGNVFGVKWTVDSGSALTRLTSSNDPYNYVNVDITTEPNPANFTSPFDHYMPWSGMTEYYSNGASPVKWAGGTSYYSYLHYLVYIPTFYYKIIKIDNTWYYYISDEPNSEAGFTVHPGSNRYIGKYLSGIDYDSGETYGSWVIKSKTDLPCMGYYLNDISSSAYQVFEDHKGYLCDIATRFAVMLLYLIEYANWNARQKIGVSDYHNLESDGNTQSYLPFITGATNSILYHTSPPNSKRVKYRNIEDVYGVGGEGFSGMAMKMQSNKLLIYASSSPTRNFNSSNMTLIFTSKSIYGYIKDFEYNSSYPWCCFIPSAVSSSSTNTTNNYRTSIYPTSDSAYYTIESNSNSSMLNFFSHTACEPNMSHMSRPNGRLLYVP